MRVPTIQASDFFCVSSESGWDLSAQQVLLQLYQPILGASAAALYLTLQGYALLLRSPHSDGAVDGEGRRHAELFTTLSLSIEDFLQARYRLEALGLLRSYVSKGRDELGDMTTYQLMAPLLAEAFFCNDILALMLYERLGEKGYRERKAALCKKNLSPRSALEVTRSFESVFPPLQQSERVRSELNDLVSPFALEQIASMPSGDVLTSASPLDMDKVRGLLDVAFRSKSLQEPETQIRLQQIAAYTGVEEEEMVDILRRHLLERTEIEWEALRQEVLNSRFRPGAVWSATQQEVAATREPMSMQGSGRTKAQVHQMELELVHPLTLLEAYHKGAKVPQSDARLVQSLLQEYQLKACVVNVLIEYVMFTNEYKLPRALVEKIAGHWKRLGIETVQQAQEICRRDHVVYRNWKGGGERSRRGAATRQAPANLPKSIEQQLRQQQEVPPLAEGEDILKEQLHSEKEERALALLRALGEAE